MPKYIIEADGCREEVHLINKVIVADSKEAAIKQFYEDVYAGDSDYDRVEIIKMTKEGD